jgi:DHA2 family lincomycin resistance protein-like MFS transporter
MSTQERKMDFTDAERRVIMIPLLLGGFVALLNETILNVAVPSLMASLKVSTSTVQWLSTGYMLIIGILVPVVAFLLENFTTRKLYLFAMSVFLFGTICCGFAESFPVLLVFRLVQGAGTGMLIPIMMNMIMVMYPPEKRGSAMGLSVLVMVAAPAIAPTLGGIILQRLGWHWLFFSVIPFAVAAIALGYAFLRNVSSLKKPKIDILSVCLSTAGFGGILFGVCSIESLGLRDPAVAASLAGGLGGITLFSFRQFSLREPMLDLRAFRFPMFSLGIVIMMLGFLIPFSMNIILPTYLQGALGMTPFQSGLAMLPGSILCVLVVPLSGIMYDRIGAKPLVVSGFALLALSMFFLSRISAGTTLAAIIALHMCTYLGTSLVNTPIQTNSLNQLPKSYHAHGVAIVNTLQQIAAAFGSSLFIGLLGARQEKILSVIQNPTPLDRQSAMVSGAGLSFSAALLAVLVALIASLFIRKKSANVEA